MLADFILSAIVILCYVVHLFSKYSNDINKIMSGTKDSALFMNFIATDKYFMFVFILTILTTVMGGYITSKIAKKNIYLNLVAYSLSSTLLGILTVPDIEIPGISTLSLFVIGAIAPFVGGWIWSFFQKNNK